VWLGLLPFMVLYLGVALGLPQISLSGTIISDAASLRMLLIWPAMVLFLLGIGRSAVAKKAGQSAKQILEGQWLLASVGYYSMVPLVQGVLKAIFTKRQTFDVTMKNPRHIQAKQITQDMWFVVLLSLTGIVAIIYAPTRAIFALPWLLTIASSPLCLIICHSKSSR
jgi:Na+-transporting methylmalonyl-CoA/oxaloacetate decarboxylase beta subunit